MKRLLPIILLAIAFGKCFAPINEAPPAGMNLNTKTATEAELQQQQGYNRVQGVIGSVPDKTEVNRVDTPTEDEAARHALQNGLVRDTATTDPDKAKEALAASTEAIARKRTEKVRTALWAVILTGLGFGVVYGLRKWADKVVPEMPTRKKITW